MQLGHFADMSRHMDSEDAILALAALAQTTRLDVFRRLFAAEPDGVAAGDLARGLAVPHNTMSSHLSVLTRAGLVRSERRSRSIIYRADLSRVRELLGFLVQDCCGGRPDVCAPLFADLAACATKERCHG